MGEEVSEQAEQYQRYRERIEEHEHGDGVGYYRVQAEVRYEERQQGEEYAPAPVGAAVRKHGGEGLGAARHEADGGFQAGERYGPREDERARLSEIAARDYRENLTAVRAGLVQPAALRADYRYREVYGRHDEAAEDSRLHGVRGDCARAFHAEAAYDVYDDDAEGEARERVHSVVALDEALRESAGGVGLLRRDGADFARGRGERRGHHHAEENEKDRREHLADPCKYLAGVERKGEHGGEEAEREGRERQRAAVRAEQRRGSDGERDRGAARNRKERPYRHIKRAGEEVAVFFSDAAAELEQAAAAADPERGDAEQRQPDARNQKARRRAPYIAARHVPEVDGEDEVPRSEEQPEQHHRYIKRLLHAQMLFHVASPSFYAAGIIFHRGPRPASML